MLRLGLEGHQAYIRINEGELLDKDDLLLVEKEVLGIQRKRESKETAKEAIPILLQEAEDRIQSLPKIEQYDFEKKLSQYRKDIKQMKRPQKIEKNLKWLISKMSEYE